MQWHKKIGKVHFRQDSQSAIPNNKHVYLHVSCKVTVNFLYLPGGHTSVIVSTLGPQFSPCLYQCHNSDPVFKQGHNSVPSLTWGSQFSPYLYLGDTILRPCPYRGATIQFLPLHGGYVPLSLPGGYVSLPGGYIPPPLPGGYVPLSFSLCSWSAVTLRMSASARITATFFSGSLLV
jgi:hypothetical protein